MFAADAAASLQLSILASLSFADGGSAVPGTTGSVVVPLVSRLTVHDGDSLPVTLKLTVPMTFAPRLSSALGPSTFAIVQLCDPSGGPNALRRSLCSNTVDPIVGLPPFSSADAGGDAQPADAVDATADGAVLETSDAAAPETPDANTGGD